MAVIYTSENNPAGLKLIVAKNLSKKDVTVIISNINDKSLKQPKHLPYLELDNNVSLFSTNAAVLYLLSSKIDDLVVNEWLEWESNILAPNLALVIGSNIKKKDVKNTLSAALKKLNEFLKNKKYLCGNQITACDISIWCTLFPLYKFGGSESFKDLLINLTSVDGWFNNLLKESSFEVSLKEFPIKDCHSPYNALLSGSKYLVAGAHDNAALKSENSQEEETVSEEDLEAARKAFCESGGFPKIKQPGKTVLPIPNEKNVFITSALPYVNNVPHLGNIIGCVLSADVFARFSRLCNHNTLYLCGTDEYGTATETKALEEKLSCKAICDKYHKIHKETYDWFNISFDYFGRTSTPEQTELCQSMFLKLNDNGFMFTQSVEQLHCSNCDRFLADRFVEGGCPNIGCTYEDARGDQCDGCGKLVNAVELKNPRCKVCSQTPKLKTSNQFFIDLPKLEPLLRHWIKISSPGWTHNAQVIAQSWLKEGLKPRCITRDLKWGVPVPLDGFRDKVFYVWFDAPIGYMSMTKAYTEEYEKWWIPGEKTDVELYQFMAKDNVPFHSVLFPSMLLGANKGYLTVSHLMATEYLNYEDGKFSKSRGVGVFGTDVQNTGISSDVWRFYLLYVRPESQDSSFSWADLATKNNSELLNNLGNFVNRSLVFAKNNFGGVVPKMELLTEDLTLLAHCTKEFKAYVSALEKCKLRDGIRHILSISKFGNQYMQSNQPWVLVKGTDEQKLRAGTVIGLCTNIVALLEMLLRPYMPETSANLKKQLNTTDLAIDLKEVRIVQLTPSGHKIGEPSPLFAKIEPARIEELQKMFAGTQAERKNGVPAELEAEVQKQADKVRQLKSSGAAKTLWAPEVQILLDLKKKLEECKKKKPNDEGDVPLSGTAEKLEDEVAKQGAKVRSLKSGGAEKSAWQPEVSVLLSLKKKLEGLQKVLAASPKSDAQPNGKNEAEIKRLEDEVAKQALKVRTLKESKAEKSVWQPEVELLLKLKQQLTAAGGAPAAPPAKGKKGK